VIVYGGKQLGEVKWIGNLTGFNNLAAGVEMV